MLIRKKRILNRMIKVRAAHEVMALGAAELAAFVDQLVAAAEAIAPMLASAGSFNRTGGRF
jgi:hypothetical protein